MRLQSPGQVLDTVKIALSMDSVAGTGVTDGIG